MTGATKPAAKWDRQAVDEELSQQYEEITAVVQRRLNQLAELYTIRLLQDRTRWGEMIDRAEARLAKAETLYEAMAETKTALEREVETLKTALSHTQEELQVARAALAARRATERAVETLPIEATPTTSPRSPLAVELNAKGFEIIDMRPSGSLWLVGEAAALKPVLAEMKQRGIVFRYAANGSRSTGGRAAWWSETAE